MTAMTILVTHEGDAGILHIAGDITSGSEPDLVKAYSQATDAGATVIILDFSGLEYMNSGGIGLLVTLLCERSAPASASWPSACLTTTARSCR